MKEFDRHACCSKCGSRHISFHYQGGYMQRRYVECGHSWREAPLDAKGKDDGQRMARLFRAFNS